MIDHAHDLANVFFGPDFASSFLRVRYGETDAPVMLILGTTDEETLESRVMAATRTARYAAGPDVRADDHLVATEQIAPDLPAGTTFRVLDTPVRVNDGQEMEALLGSVAS